MPVYLRITSILVQRPHHEDQGVCCEQYAERGELHIGIRPQTSKQDDGLEYPPVCSSGETMIKGSPLVILSETKGGTRTSLLGR